MCNCPSRLNHSQPARRREEWRKHNNQFQVESNESWLPPSQVGRLSPRSKPSPSLPSFNPGHLHSAHSISPNRVESIALLKTVLGLLCTFHHHLVHEGGWSVARGENGELAFAAPDGRALPIESPRQMVEAVLESLHEWAADRGSTLARTATCPCGTHAARLRLGRGGAAQGGVAA